LINPSIDSSEWESFKKRFNTAQSQRPSLIAAALSSAVELPLNRAKTYYLTGGALNVQTGRLRSSVTKRPSTGAVRQGDTYSVEIGTNVFYGRAWETGFKVPARVILPTNAKALRFVIGGRVVFSKRVFQPARNQKAKPWLRPSISDTTKDMIDLLAKVGVTLEAI
jgi:hypothetical protein